MPGRGTIANLAVELGMDSTRFTRESSRVKKDVGVLESRFKSLGVGVKGLVAGFAGALTIGALTDLITSSIDFASALEEQATQLGVNVRELQEYRFVATQVGVSQDEMDASLSKLTRTLGDAAAGGKAQKAAFENLGISIRDAEGKIKSAGDVIPEIADALAKLPDPAQRAAALVDLFGKAGQKLAPLMAEGAAGIKSLREEAQRLGVVLTEDEIKNADKIADDFAALQNTLKISISSAVLQNAEAIQVFVKALIDLVSWIGKTVKGYQELNALRSKVDKAYSIIDAKNAPEDIKKKAKEIARRKILDPEYEDITGNPFGLGTIKKKREKPLAAPAGPAGGRLGAGGVLALSGIDFSLIPELAQYAVTETNRVWQGLSLVPPFTRQLDMTAEEFADWRARLAENTQSIVDDLYPEEAERADILAKFSQLDEALAERLITPERWIEVRGRLGIELQKVQAQIDQSGVLIKPGDIEVAEIETGIKELGANIRKNVGDESENSAQQASRAFSELAIDIENTFGGFKRGGLSGILQGIVGIASIAGRFGAFGGGSDIPGFATGGSFRVGGAGGTDSKLVRFMATPGEMVNITKPGQSGGGGAMVFDMRGAVVTEQLLGQINDMVARGEARAVQGGAKLATDRLQYNNRRRLG